MGVGVGVGAGRAKRLPRAVREQQMLDAAVRTFGRRGYRAASMDEIAELAGVSKPLVYLYLNSKEDLFTACVRREARALTAAVRAGVRHGLPADGQLWSGLRAFFEHTARNPDGWAVLHYQARTHGDPFAAEAAAVREEIVAFVTELIAAAAREARRDPDLPGREVAGLAEALVGAAESLADWAGATEGVTAKQAAATLMNFAWAGLGDLMADRPWTAPADAADADAADADGADAADADGADAAGDEGADAAGDEGADAADADGADAAGDEGEPAAQGG